MKYCLQFHVYVYVSTCTQYCTYVSGELCCVALPFCYVVVALPLSASLGVIVHAQYLVWGLVSSWFNYC